MILQNSMSANIATQYHHVVQDVLARIVQTQMPALEEGARRIADTIRRDGIVYSAGAGHSMLVAAETYFRAGNMANFDVINDPTFARAERVSGYAKVLLDSYPISANDLLIVVSNSGRNPLPVETALEGRARGIYTIGITSLAHAQSVAARPPVTQRLFEACDLTLDNCGVIGDSTVPLQAEREISVCPTSSLAGIFIMNCLTGMAAQLLADQGVTPPVFLSYNSDGADAWNAPLFDFLVRRVRGL